MSFVSTGIAFLIVASALVGVALPGTLPSDAARPAGSPSTWTAPSPAVTPSQAIPSPAASITTLLSVPGASTPTSMAYDIQASYMLLVTPTANASVAGSAVIGTWVYDHGGWTELALSTAPPAREYASLVYDGQDDSVLLFGGYSPTGAFLNDTWGFSAGHWTDLTADSTLAPAPRADAQVAYDSAGGYVVLFGGYGATGLLSDGTFSDTWLYHNGTWTSVSSSTTPPPSGAMAYDANTSQMIYYGGVTLLGLCVASTYAFNGKEWTDISSSISGSPGAIALESMTYDSEYGGVVAFGGVCGVGIAGISLTLTSSNSMWGLYDDRWSEISTTAAPPASYGGDLAFDASSGAIVLFGGVQPTLVGLGTVTQRLLGGTFLCAEDVWARLGPDLTTLPLAETGMNVSVAVTNAVTAGPTSFNYSGLPGACVGVSGPTVTCVPSRTGNFTMNVNVSLTLGLPGTALGVANETASAAIRIVPGLQMSPLVASRSVTEVGVPITLSDNVSDGVNVSSYEYADLPTGCASVNASSVACTPSGSGSFEVSLTALDALGVHETEVIPVEVAARTSVGSFSLSRAVLDLGMETNLSTLILGGVGPFDVAVTGMPQGCASSDALTIACRPNATGTFGLALHVQDSLSVEASSAATLTVNPLPAVRSLTLSEGTVQVGNSSELFLNLTGGTVPFTVAYSGLPIGCTSANTTELSCAPSVKGNYTIVVTATDAVGMSASASVGLTVDAGSVPCSSCGGPGGPSGPTSRLPTFTEGLVSGAALFAVLVSAFLIRGRSRSSESRRLAEELERGVSSEGVGLEPEIDPILRK